MDTALRVELDKSLEDYPRKKTLPQLEKLLGLVDKLIDFPFILSVLGTINNSTSDHYTAELQLNSKRREFN